MSVVIGIAVVLALVLGTALAVRLPRTEHRQWGAGHVDRNQYDTRLAPPSTSTAAGSAWGGGGGWGGGAAC
ncbi:hypothetical protein [Geodermatophilus sp. CPCC 206100]|uniref:hypothetical protein n=1 Tax=Geodermatophilus sp. CPCC 206100 TaxID=3020054 RepID=UPI003AFFC4D5